jgi:hypothetical protein
MTPNSERAYRDELGKLRASFEHTARKNYRQAKDGGCTCWEGYERVPGTKPCADGSCRKKSAEKVKRHKLTDPGPLGNGKDDKMPSISEELGEDWHKRGPGGKYARENRRSR